MINHATTSKGLGGRIRLACFFQKKIPLGIKKNNLFLNHKRAERQKRRELLSILVYR